MLDFELLADVPGAHVFATMEPQARKNLLVDKVNAVLDAIEGQSRQPDAWEGGELADAMSLVRVNWAHAACGALWKAFVPDEERGGGPYPRNETTPTLEQLRDALADAANAPLRIR